MSSESSPSTTDELCHCGKPLHYTSPEIEAKVRAIVAEKGEYVDITVDGHGTWRVQRHYVALHGVKGNEIADLGFERVA